MGSSRKSKRKFKNPFKKKIISILIFTVVALVTICLIMVPVHNKSTETKRIYNEAIGLIDAENYSEAYSKLEYIVGSNYQDTISLLYLCNSHILYEEGNVKEAYEEIKKVNFYNLPEEKAAKIDEYKAVLAKECGVETPETVTEAVEENKKTEGENKIEKKYKSQVKSAEEEFAYEETESFENDGENTNEGN